MKRSPIDVAHLLKEELSRDDRLKQYTVEVVAPGISIFSYSGSACGCGGGHLHKERPIRLGGYAVNRETSFWNSSPPIRPDRSIWEIRAEDFWRYTCSGFEEAWLYGGNRVLCE